MPKLKWLCSYETLKFNTPDGDLHKGQYAFFGNKHYVRMHPENNDQFVCLEDFNLENPNPVNIQSFISGFQKVDVVVGEFEYYDKFLLPNGRLLRVKSNQKDYRDLGKKGALPREKTMNEKEIEDAQKGDIDW